MFRTLPQLTKIVCVSLVVGCASPEELKAPPSTNGGNTSAGQGGSAATGGSSASDTSVTATGGAVVQTGGNANGQGGARATGGVSNAGGAVARTGGSSSIGTSPIVFKFTSQLTADQNQGTLLITLAAGAASLPASSLKFTLCGKGEGVMPTANALNVNDARLVCPSDNPPPAGCPNPSYDLRLTDPGVMSITVTGVPSNCCYNLDMSKVTPPLASGGRIEIHYLFNNGTSYHGLQKENQTWTALVDGQPVATCTIGAWADNYPVKCS